MPITGPTPEQMDQGAYERAGIAFRRVPMIDTLLTRQVINGKQHAAFSRYRDAFIACERSDLRSCLDDRPKGGGNGPAPATVRAGLALGRLDHALGALAPITRFVVGEDNSLSQWAIRQGGCKSAAGVCLPKSRQLELARLDLLFAASRLIPIMEA